MVPSGPKVKGRTETKQKQKKKCQNLGNEIESRRNPKINSNM